MDLLTSTPELLKGKRFRFREPGHPTGRLSIYDPPEPGDTYVIGMDSAFGIEGRDKSTLCVLNKSDQKRGVPVRQVAEAEGCWGPESFHAVCYAMIRHYNDAFFMGEAQGGGVVVMRTLWHQYEYRWMYCQETLGKAATVVPPNPTLGWNRAANDVTLTEGRDAVAKRKCLIYSEPLLNQMGKLKWVPRNTKADQQERVQDDALKIKLVGGGSPDLVMAWLYAWYALSQVYLFDKPEPAFKPGTYGEVFGLDKKLPGLFKPAPATGMVVHRPKKG